MGAKKTDDAGLELGSCRQGSLGQSLEEVTFGQRPRGKLPGTPRVAGREDEEATERRVKETHVRAGEPPERQQGFW